MRTGLLRRGVSCFISTMLTIMEVRCFGWIIAVCDTGCEVSLGAGILGLAGPPLDSAFASALLGLTRSSSLQPFSPQWPTPPFSQVSVTGSQLHLLPGSGLQLTCTTKLFGVRQWGHTKISKNVPCSGGVRWLCLC